MDKILLIGAGGHARSCADVIELTGLFEIAGFVEKNNLNSNQNLDYFFLGTDDDLPYLRKKYEYAHIAVGHIKNVEIRIKLFQLLREIDYTLPTIVSPRAYISKNAQIGDGTIIMHDAIVNANARIGQNCIINSKALVEHDAIIGDHCHIATGAIVNGEVIIGNKNFLGSGAVTKQSISIGSNCVIGAGVVVKKDIEPSQVIKN